MSKQETEGLETTAWDQMDTDTPVSAGKAKLTRLRKKMQDSEKEAAKKQERLESLVEKAKADIRKVRENLRKDLVKAGVPSDNYYISRSSYLPEEYRPTTWVVRCRTS